MQPGDLLSKFRVAGRPSLNCRELSMRPEDLPSSSDNLPCGHRTFCHNPSAFRATESSSIKCHQLSVIPVDFPSHSVSFSYSRCHRKSDSPTLRYPHVEFPRIFSIRIPNILRICSIPKVPPCGIWYPLRSLLINDLLLCARRLRHIFD